MKKIPLSRGIYLIPSLCTTVSLFFGFFSVVRALSGDFFKSAIAIYFCAFFDMLDGRIARMTRTESDFGVEYDSLVDFASFGLAPAILIYTWSLKDYHRLGWLVAFFFFACGALRLARYNIQIGTIEKKRFQGLPIPAAALTLASFVILYQEGYGIAAIRGPVALILTLILAPLMVTRIRYRSFKDLDFRSPHTFYWLLFAVGLLLVIALRPEVMPFALFLVYVLSGPFEEIFFLRRRKVDRRPPSSIEES